MIKKLIALVYRRSIDREKGSITIEFAFAAPILTVLVLGAADFGVLMNTAASLRGARAERADIGSAG